jgi:hypothetical protein
MKKAAIYFLVLLFAASLFVGFAPKAFSQTGTMTVKSYSSYISANTGDFIVVGEVQNVGTETITYGALTGTVYSTDGQEQAQAYYWYVYATQVLPNDTVPFYMGFTADSSASGNMNWATQPIGRIDIQTFSYSNASQELNLTLSITGETVQANPINGTYSVSGLVSNNGDQNMTNIQVAGAFYNSSGTVIAIGYTDYLAYPALPPGQSVQFSVSPVDSTPAIVSKITSYSLNIVSTGPPLNQTVTPSPTPTASEIPTASPSETASPSPTQSTSNTPSSSPDIGTTLDSNLYVIIGVVVAVVAVVVIILAIVLKRRAKA